MCSSGRSPSTPCRSPSCWSLPDRSEGFPGHPDLLGWPLVRPFARDVVEPALGPLRRLELHEPLDLEAVRTEQLDPVSVAQMELDLAGVRPVEPMHAEIVAPQLHI